MEKWESINNYEEYQISNLGNIKRNNKILKPFKNTNGYYQIDLFKEGERKRFLIHKLVVDAFIKNVNNYSYVNHKDENKLNNNVDNLEWCTAKYNCNYGTRNKRLSSPVICIELNKKYQSIQEASKELNIQQAHISGCCAKRKHYNTAGGYHWQYVKEV